MKRALSIILTAALLAGCLPLGALAMGGNKTFAEDATVTTG